MRLASRFLLLLLGLASLGTARTSHAIGALPWSHNIRLVSPADGATIVYTSEDDVVTFSFHADVSAVVAEEARTGPTDTCGINVNFYVSCDGSSCKGGTAGTLVRVNHDLVTLKVGDLLALANDSPGGRRALVWGGEVRDRENLKASPPCVSVALQATAARLTLEKKPVPSGPPNLSLSVAPDVPGTWPKSVVVTDKGGPSKSTFLVVTVKTLSPKDPAVARNCALMDDTKTHTVPEIAAGAQRSFDVPPLNPSQAQRDALLHALALPTPPPPKATAKVGVVQPPTVHDPNVHQVVGCQYLLTAKLGADTNGKDPDKTDNSLSRTIHIDVPMN